MSVRSLRWWSEAALATAAKTLQPAWHRWCADWEVPPGPVVATNASESEIGPEHGAEWQRAHAPGQRGPWLCQAASGRGSLADLLFAGAGRGCGVKGTCRE